MSGEIFFVIVCIIAFIVVCFALDKAGDDPELHQFDRWAKWREEEEREKEKELRLERNERR